jgi:hypothetical protein
LPLYCARFDIDEKILWMSDIGDFPASTMEHFKLPSWPHRNEVYDVVALDCCCLKDGNSHIGIAGFLQGALKFQAKRTVAIQMTHEIDSYGLDALGRMILGSAREPEHDEWLDKSWPYIDGVKKLWDRLQVEKPRIGAAYDGLRLRLAEGTVKEVAIL